MQFDQVQWDRAAAGDRWQDLDLVFPSPSVRPAQPIPRPWSASTAFWPTPASRAAACTTCGTPVQRACRPRAAPPRGPGPPRPQPFRDHYECLYSVNAEILRDAANRLDEVFAAAVPDLIETLGAFRTLGRVTGVLLEASLAGFVAGSVYRAHQAYRMVEAFEGRL
jgi:hypothetical protein